MILVESTVVLAFFIASTAAINATPWLVVALYLAHGAKDLPMAARLVRHPLA